MFFFDFQGWTLLWSKFFANIVSFHESTKCFGLFQRKQTFLAYKKQQNIIKNRKEKDDCIKTDTFVFIHKHVLRNLFVTLQQSKHQQPKFITTWNLKTY